MRLDGSWQQISRGACAERQFARLSSHSIELFLLVFFFKELGNVREGIGLDIHEVSFYCHLEEI